MTKSQGTSKAGEKLTQEQREIVAYEEYEKQPFHLISVIAMVQAGKLMFDTNVEETKTSVEVSLENKRYKVEATYTIKPL